MELCSVEGIFRESERKREEKSGNYLPLSLLHQIKLTYHLQKLPEEVLTNWHHDATTFGASLTTREARNVGNTSLPEFGATVPDIGPRRPKSSDDGRLLNPTTLHALGELPNSYLAKFCWRTPTSHINLQPSVLAPLVTPVVPNSSK
ncbi:hypothetical protein PIB30_046024, partial [Stylosanthes scabra]|nr:hypothetical protein [Stylosanthes scabra]